MKIEPNAVFFGGGFGDVIHRIYNTDAYTGLDLANVNIPVRIINATNNPFVSELFYWHPKRRHFRIIDGFPIIMDYYQRRDFEGAKERDRELVCRAFGIPVPDEPNTRRVGLPRFHGPIPGEIPGVAGIDEPYLVASFGAAGIHRGKFDDEAEHNYSRKVPPEIAMRSIVALAHAVHPLRLFIVTRAEPLLLGSHWNAPENVYQSPNLTIPDTLNLIRGASGFIGSFSALSQFAWFERKPNVILYPPDHADWQTPGGGYTFGASFSETLALPYFGNREANANLDQIVDHFSDHI